MRPQTYDQRFAVHFQRVVLSRFRPKAQRLRLDQLVAIQPEAAAKINCRQSENIAPIGTKDGELLLPRVWRRTAFLRLPIGSLLRVIRVT
jgi:hypothetical protein